MLPLILGSQSPRRREIMSFFTLPFVQVSPDFDEEAVPFHGDPEEYAKTLARGKAESLAHEHRKNLILTADTIVYCDGKLYGKPADENEAFRFLSVLKGRWHSVYTAVHLIHGSDRFDAIEETRVLFNDLSDKQIRSYHQSLNYKDKAGGYAIQGAGSLIVNRIDGCYYNVMGLPINAVRGLLLHAGIDLWNNLK